MLNTVISSLADWPRQLWTPDDLFYMAVFIYSLVSERFVPRALWLKWYDAGTSERNSVRFIIGAIVAIFLLLGWRAFLVILIGRVMQSLGTSARAHNFQQHRNIRDKLGKNSRNRQRYQNRRRGGGRKR